MSQARVAHRLTNIVELLCSGRLDTADDLGASTDRKEVISSTRRRCGTMPRCRGGQRGADARTTVCQNGDRLPTKQVSRLRASWRGSLKSAFSTTTDTTGSISRPSTRRRFTFSDAGIKKSRKGRDRTMAGDRLVERKRKADEHYAGQQGAAGAGPSPHQHGKPRRLPGSNCRDRGGRLRDADD